MEHILPFYLAPGGSVVTIPGPSGTLNGRIELHVITGGPVYLWRGRKSAPEAATILTGGGVPDFDIAATINDKGETSVNGGMEVLTPYSPNESIGYVRVIVAEVDMVQSLLKGFEQLAREVATNGLRIERVLTDKAIPIMPNSPELSPMHGSRSIPN